MIFGPNSISRIEPITILAAIGPADSDRLETIAGTVRKIVGHRDSRVAIGHVLRESAYEDAVERLVPREKPAGGPMSRARPETGALHVGSSRDLDPEFSEGDTVSPTATAKQVIGQQTLIRDAADAFEAAGVSAEIHGAIGDPAERIVGMISELDADFVVVGGRSRSPTRQAFFGSVSQEIIRSAESPVVSVRESATE